MKSNVFGYSAKLALTVLTVCGTLFTSCYESDDLVTPPVTPEPAAYYIVGSIVDAQTLQPLNATVTIDNESVTVTNGAFGSKNLTKEGTYTVTAAMEGYNEVKKGVILVKVAAGQVNVGNADIVMYKDSYLPGVPPDAANRVRLTANQLKTSFGFPEATTVDEDGNIVVAENGTTNGNVLTYSRYTGFIMSDVVTRAVPTYDEAARNVAKYLNRVHAGKKFENFTKVQGTVDYSQDAHDSHGSLKSVEVKQIMEAYEFVFDNSTVTAIYNKEIILTPKFDGHGSGGNAGGGEGGSSLN